jgi:hypothetical protein
MGQSEGFRVCAAECASRSIDPEAAAALLLMAQKWLDLAQKCAEPNALLALAVDEFNRSKWTPLFKTLVSVASMRPLSCNSYDAGVRRTMTNHPYFILGTPRGKSATLKRSARWGGGPSPRTRSPLSPIRAPGFRSHAWADTAIAHDRLC